MISRSSFFILLLFIFSCNDASNKKRSSLLRKAKGAPGEVILVMDPVLWKGEVGKAIKEVFMGAQVALPQEEPLFTIRKINPLQLNSVLEEAYNMVFVTSFDINTLSSRKLQHYFTQESVSKIKQDTSLFMHVEEDIFAKNQLVMYLFGNTKAKLADKILTYKLRIRELFNTRERDRWIKKHKRNSSTGLMQAARDKLGLKIVIPYGFDLSIQQNDFMWLRRMEGNKDKNIFITYNTYDDENLFNKDALINIRNSIGKKYIWGSDSLSYMETELKYEECYTREVNLNGQYAMEIRGLWRLHNGAMGGPFIGYGLVDETRNRFFYIESFVYAPGGKKREELREMEASLWTVGFAEK